MQGPSPKRARFLSPCERNRSFMIQNLLNDQPIQQGQGAKKPEDYIEKLEGSLEHNKKFNFIKCRSKFIIRDVPADPESLLLGIFQFCIDEAIENAKEKGFDADELGCTISSALLDPDIYTPFRPINENTVEAILNRFLLVAQSKKQKDITLWGEPFTVNITLIDKKLPTKRTIKGSAPRKLAPVRHRISKRSLIKIQNFGDKYCLFYALQATFFSNVVENRSQFYEYMHGRYGYKGRFQRDTAELMRNVDAPIDLKEYDATIWIPKVVDYWNNKYVNKHRIKVFVFGDIGNYKPIFKYGAEIYDMPLLLFHSNNHFDGVNELGGLFGTRYCLACEKPFTNEQKHLTSCTGRCINCSRVGPEYPCKPFRGFKRHCHLCEKDFTNNNCYRHHLQSGFCKFSKRCPKCHKIYRVEQNTRDGRSGHVCGERYCEKCRTWHDPKRGCFIQTLEPKPLKPCRFISFDVETMQHTKIDDEKYEHKVNFIGARVACPQCIAAGKWRNSLKGDQCEVCGPHRTISFNQREFSETQVDNQIVTNNPVRCLVQWLLHSLSNKYETYVFSHFGGRFDMLFILRELFMQGINPEMIKNGNKMYELKVNQRRKGNNKIFFRDSFNLMPMSLAALVPAFGLEVEDKPYFPHMANRPENYGRQIYPTKADYLADGMMPSKRAAFDKWFEENKHKPFHLDDALAAYGMVDVEILMCALVAFRDEFMTMTARPDGTNRAASVKPHDGIDVLRESMTIASACMKHFRTNHLKTEQVAIFPERGYDNADNQSQLALKYLNWYEQKHNVKIQSAHSAEGEKKIANYRIDGWVEEKQYGIEVYGCGIHGCPKCYPNDDDDLPIGKTAGWVRERDQRRMDFILTQVPEMKIVWECEIKAMKEKDAAMRRSFDEYMDDGPIDIRSCFYGGRTGPLKLYHQVQHGEKAAYADVQSLYPFINSTVLYPIGIPKVHILNEEVNWSKPEDNPYPLAIIKCVVVPPRKIDVPVLPLKVKDRLLFPLCAKCANKYPEGAVLENYSCAHTDHERSWVSTSTSIELNMALSEGYTVTKVFRVLEYLDGDDKLFRSYMSEFMAAKIHASGFTGKIKGNPELEIQFIRECQEMFGILIDKAKMLSNKGKRALAKLAVNNLWGRLALRCYGLSQCRITDDPAEYAEILSNKSLEITAVDQVTPDVILVSFLKKKEWVEEHASANVLISLWTTSAARLHLLKSMQKVARTPGCQLLYTDTDSIIYIHPEGANPIEYGPHLGQFTDEYEKHDILEYVSGGAKQYGLKLRKKGDPTAEFEYVLKIRGMTLNYDVVNNQGLRYETFKQKVLKYATTGKVDPIKIVYPHFLRPSIVKSRIVTQPMTKVYKPFVGKGIVSPTDYHVLDFGYINS